MADPANVFDQARESQVYISADIQGYLEKKGTGVLRSKSKTWCSLQGVTLYLQKSQGDVMSTIDVRDAQQVRKIPSDVSGTQFEICLRKKSHVFVCQSSDECQAWVRALQKAMVLNEGTGSRNSNFFVDVEEDNPYSTVDETNTRKPTEKKSVEPNANETKEKLSVKVSEYAEPCDAQPLQTFTGIHSEYSEIGDFANSSTSKSPKPGGNSDPNPKASGSPQKSYTDASSLMQGNSTFSGESYTDASSLAQSENRVYDYGYSEVKKPNRKNDDACLKQTTGTPAGSPDSAGGKTLESSIASCEPGTPVMRNSTRSSSVSGSVGDDNEDENLFKFLDEALAEDKIPNPSFVHPLTSEDQKPIAELKAFMKNNNQFFQASYNSVAGESNPVEDLKSVLRSLNVIS